MFSTVFTLKICKIVVTEEDIQKSWANVLSAIFKGCDEDFASAFKTSTENMAALRLNMAFIDEFYSALKVFRDSLISETTQDCDVEEAFESYLKVSKNFLNSQKGLENFLTDEEMKKDPNLANIYLYFDQFRDAGRQIIEDRSLVDEYFSRDTANFFAKFLMKMVKIASS